MCVQNLVIARSATVSSSKYGYPRPHPVHTMSEIFRFGHFISLDPCTEPKCVFTLALTRTTVIATVTFGENVYLLLFFSVLIGSLIKIESFALHFGRRQHIEYST